MSNTRNVLPMKIYDINPASIVASEEFLEQDSLVFNSAIGVVSSSGNSNELVSFVSTMKPHHVNSFLGGSIYVEKLQSPLLVYRTGDIGKYWSTTQPLSPYQHSLEMAMHPSLYPASMKEIPNFHPANKGILVYQVPAGQIIAKGIAAPQATFPGMKEQIFIQNIKQENVQGLSWNEWKEKPQTIKILDLKKQVSQNNSPRFDATISWRPGISESRQAPWHQRINYNAAGQAIVKIVRLPLMGWDIYNRIKYEIKSHPNDSNAEHMYAVAAGLTWDLSERSFLTNLTGSAISGTGLFFTINSISNLANNIRYIPVESVKDNRDLFVASINDLELSPEIERRWLQAFDEGATWTREFNMNTARVAKTSLKPFALVYDVKQAIMHPWQFSGRQQSTQDHINLAEGFGDPKTFRLPPFEESIQQLKWQQHSKFLDGSLYHDAFIKQDADPLEPRTPELIVKSNPVTPLIHSKIVGSANFSPLDFNDPEVKKMMKSNRDFTPPKLSGNDKDDKEYEYEFKFTGFKAKKGYVTAKNMSTNEKSERYHFKLPNFYIADNLLFSDEENSIILDGKVKEALAELVMKDSINKQKSHERLQQLIKQIKSDEAIIHVDKKMYELAQQVIKDFPEVKEIQDLCHDIITSYQAHQKQEAEIKEIKKNNKSIQQLTGQAMRIMTNYADRFGGETLQSFAHGLSRLQQVSPNFMSMTLQLPKACFDEGIAWRTASERQLMNSYQSLAHPFSSFNNVSQNLNLAYTLLTFTSLSTSPEFTFYGAGLIRVIGATSTAYKAYLVYQAGKSLAKFGPFAIDAVVDGTSWLINYYSSDGNLPEDVEYYYMKDASKLLLSSYLPVIPVVTWYIVGQALYNQYNYFSGEYHERALQARMQNASYFIKHANFHAAQFSIDKIVSTLNMYYNGLKCSQSDTPIIKQAKIFVYHYQLENIFKSYKNKLNNNEDAQKEVKIILEQTQIDTVNKCVSVANQIPFSEIPNTVLYRLQILLCEKDLDVQIFFNEFNLLYRAVQQYDAIKRPEESFGNNMTAIARLARNQFARLAVVYQNENNMEQVISILDTLQNQLDHQPYYFEHLEPLSLYCLGSLYLKHNLPRAAITCFDEISIKDKDNLWQVWYELALAVDQLRHDIKNDLIHAQINFVLKICFKSCVGALMRLAQLNEQEREILIEAQKAYSEVQMTQPEKYLQKANINPEKLLKRFLNQQWSSGIEKILATKVMTKPTPFITQFRFFTLERVANLHQTKPTIKPAIRRTF